MLKIELKAGLVILTIGTMAILVLVHQKQKKNEDALVQLNA